jgi:ferritin
MLTSKIIEQLNYRIQQEEFSSRLYKQMSLWLNDEGFINLSKIYNKYSQEELDHASWAADFLLAHGIKPDLKELNAPNDIYEISSLKDILDLILSHEKEITNQCNDLASLALKENSHTLYSLASKYCHEQVEELEKAITFLDIYSKTKDELFYDHYIGENYLD